MHTNTHGAESPAKTEGRLIRWASFYDALANIVTLGQVGRLRQMTIEQALLQPGETLLDVGCGTGGVTLPAKRRIGDKGSAAGIDPSPEMIAVARRKAQRAGLEIDLRVGVIESLPFQDDTFDVVTASLMMHHLPKHLQSKGLSEIRRVLKPGGRILIADMIKPSTSFRKGFFTTLPLHHRHAQFAAEDLLQLLQEASFEDMKQLNARFLTIGFVGAKKPVV
ncbi:MAG: methyltransferase domain-containing protein [Chloroflexi bacterium]|nr:MAG: methyltransferase domain-containing protein [Chloroflexota bacterium]